MTGCPRLDKTIPAHVPGELVVNVDIHDIPESDRDPQAAWRIFQGKGPLVFSPFNGGHWIATTGEDIAKIYRDHRQFSSQSIIIPDPGAGRMLPVEADPPMHRKYRSNIQDLLTPKAVEVLDPKVRELTIRLIEDLRIKGECEFISDFALQLPLIIFLNMMGFPPEDRLYLRRLIEKFTFDRNIENKIDTRNEIHAYLEKQMENRIVNPTDDAITKIINSKIDGRPYTHEEILSSLTFLLHAGLDTVAMMLGFIAYDLAKNPSHRAYIRENSSKMPSIVQEFLRRFAGPNVGRVLVSDYVYKGIFLKKGDRILLVPSLYNLDSTRIANPDEIDFNREANHITFGTGAHTCAGALLARREITIFLEEWLSRIPDFELDPSQPLNFTAAQQNSIGKLHIRWNK